MRAETRGASPSEAAGHQVGGECAAGKSALRVSRDLFYDREID